MRQIVVQYVRHCPNLAVLLERLREVGVTEGEIHLLEVGEGGLVPAGFAGSPTILVDGVNPLGSPEVPSGASCALRLATVEELREALGAS